MNRGFRLSYTECAAQGHNYKKVWRRSHMLWTGWRRVRQCKDCGVVILREAK